MIRVILHGCSGRMGRIITDICATDQEMEIVAGVDAFGDSYAGYPVYRTLDECPEADVVIDFSNASAIDGLLGYCSQKTLPAVVEEIDATMKERKDAYEIIMVNDIYNDGSIYKGSFKSDKFNGHGIYYFPDGERYMGTFKESQFCGKGIYIYPNGD